VLGKHSTNEPYPINSLIQIYLHIVLLYVNNDFMDVVLYTNAFSGKIWYCAYILVVVVSCSCFHYLILYNYHVPCNVFSLCTFILFFLFTYF
jgi:hypothetical protein